MREAGQTGAGGAETASTGDTAGGDRQRIDGGSGASADQDPLAAALAGALSQGTEGGGQDATSADPLQLAPTPIRPTPLPDPAREPGADAGGPGNPPMGEPLSLSEKDGLKFAIQDCWNVGALSVEASRMTISVGFSMTPDGRPEPASLRMADYRGGSETAARQAFDVARRAILMCGRAGFALPSGKYGRWRDVVVDFRPDGVGFE